MGGSTKRQSTAPQETAGLRQGVMGYLMGGPATTAQAAARPQSAAIGRIFGRENTAVPFSNMMNSNAAGVQTGGPQPGQGYDRMVAQMPDMIQSVDQLGGANSPFFANMMQQLQPMFTQQRDEAMAAAREGAGNLTGSGFGNILGSAINRSLGQEQATAAQYAQQGLQMELQRQQANQQTQAQLNDANAARYAQLLAAMSTAGLGPDQIVKSGGIGSILAPVAGIAGSFLGGPAGGIIASSIGKRIGG